MAGLLQRGDIWYITFSRTIDGKQEKKTLSLRTDSRKRAEELCARFGAQYERGEIDPWFDWSPKIALEQERKERKSFLLSEAIERFLSTKGHVKPKTLRGYRDTLESFASSVGISMPLTYITADDIRAYCLNKDFSRATQRTYLQYVRMFFKWLKEKDHVSTDVAAEVDFPREELKVAEKSITLDRFYHLIKTFKSVQRAKILKGRSRGLHPWFKPAAYIAFFGGLRRAKITGLRWEHVHFKDRILVVINSKSGKGRGVPMQEPLIQVLKAWHRLCGYPESGPVLFKTNYPGKHTGRRIPLNPETLSKTVKEYAREGGLQEAFCLHGLRHSFVTDMMRKGFALNEAGDLVGHENYETTAKYYAHLDTGDYRRKMDDKGL